MPIYEFRCEKCGKLMEVVQRVGDRPPPCPSCGSKRMTRAVSRTSFQLKGGGWYADLYSSPRKGKDDAAEGVKAPGDKPAATAKPEPGGKPGGGEAAATPAAAPKPDVKASPGPDRPRPASTRKRR